jgi:hypothetical protein
MIFSAIGAGLQALAANLEPGVATVESVVAAVCTRAAERPLDTNAVRVQPRVRAPRDLTGKALAEAGPQPLVYLSVGLVTFELTENDAMRSAGRLRHEAHQPRTPSGAIRTNLLLAAARLHTAAAEAAAAVAEAQRRAAA